MFNQRQTISNALGVVVVVSMMQPFLLIPALILGVIALKVRGIYVHTARDVKRFEGITRSPIYSHVTTTMNGLATIRAFGSQRIFERQAYRYLNDHSGTWFLYMSSSRTLGLVMDGICCLYLMIVTAVIMCLGTERE